MTSVSRGHNPERKSKKRSSNLEMRRVIHIEEQEVPSDEEINRSSGAGESDASSGSEYGVKRRKRMTKKRVISSPPESKRIKDAIISVQV
jgi:hypothetical protein